MTCVNTEDYMVTVGIHINVIRHGRKPTRTNKQCGCYRLLLRAGSDKLMLRESGSRVGVLGARAMARNTKGWLGTEDGIYN